MAVPRCAYSVSNSDDISLRTSSVITRTARSGWSFPNSLLRRQITEHVPLPMIDSALTLALTTDIFSKSSDFFSRQSWTQEFLSFGGIASYYSRLRTHKRLRDGRPRGNRGTHIFVWTDGRKD